VDLAKMPISVRPDSQKQVGPSPAERGDLLCYVANVTTTGGFSVEEEMVVAGSRLPSSSLTSAQKQVGLLGNLWTSVVTRRSASGPMSRRAPSRERA